MTGGQRSHPHKSLVSRKTCSVEKLETLSVCTKPRASRLRSPGGERRGKRKRLTIVIERTREGHRQSYKHWNCFKGNVGDGVERI